MGEPMSTAGGRRPALTPDLTGAELRRWYWLRDELAQLARQLGVSAAGGKRELTDRVAAVLDGQAPPAPARRSARGTAQLDGELTPATVIPLGQRCTQHLRVFFVSQIGPSFRFDKAMRDFIGHRSGATLGDAIDHWYRTRSQHQAPIDEQFELNRFTRRWHLAHPDGQRDRLLQDWAIYRDTPTDERPPA